jgi:hypothetical protein
MKPINPLLYIPMTLQIFSTGAGYPYYFNYLTFGSAKLLNFASIVLYIFLLFNLVKSKILNRKTFVFLAALFIPLTCAFLVSLKKPVYLVGRYDIISLPAYCLVIAASIVSLNTRIKRYGVIAGILLLSLYSLTPYFAAPRREDNSGIARYIAENSIDGDTIVFTGFRRASLQYYLDKISKKPELRLISFPERVAKHLGIYDAETYLSNPNALNYEALTIAEKLPKNGRAWIIDDKTAADVNRYLYAQLGNFETVPENSSRQAQVTCLKYREVPLK